jgi:hypothetical protein
MPTHMDVDCISIGHSKIKIVIAMLSEFNSWHQSDLSFSYGFRKSPRADKNFSIEYLPRTTPSVDLVNG